MRALEVARPRPHRPRPRHRAPVLGRDRSTATSRCAHRRSSPTSTGTTCRACRSSRRPATRVQARRLRPTQLDAGRSPRRSTSSCARRSSRSACRTCSATSVPRRGRRPSAVGLGQGEGPRRPHVGVTNGYRIEMGGGSVAYISDHQMPRRRQPRCARCRARALRRRRPADPRRAVHASGSSAKSDWGHCTSTTPCSSRPGGPPARAVPPRPGTHRRRRRPRSADARSSPGHGGRRGASPPTKAWISFG